MLKIETFSLELLPYFLQFIVKRLKSCLLGFPAEMWIYSEKKYIVGKYIFR